MIDTLGLNDYVIARSGARSDSRRMAHDRVPPAGYLECFKPNLDIERRRLWKLDVAGLATHRSAGFEILPRGTPLTARDIEACEHRWRAKLGERD